MQAAGLHQNPQFVFSTLFIPGFFGWCSTGEGGIFHLHPVSSLCFKSDDSNFVQNYFGV